MLYLAYGSNLNYEQMMRRCPKAVPISPCAINGFRLVFRGVADVIPEEGAVAQGALYDVTPDCVKALDSYEGYPFLYRKVWLNMVGDGDPCFLYQMVDQRWEDVPGDAYYWSILDGYSDWSLPKSYLRRARRRAVKNTRPWRKRAKAFVMANWESKLFKEWKDDDKPESVWDRWEREDAAAGKTTPLLDYSVPSLDIEEDDTPRPLRGYACNEVTDERLHVSIDDRTGRIVVYGD